MQLLVFNTNQKNVKIYKDHNNEIMFMFDDVPTVLVADNYYQVMQKSYDSNLQREVTVPVARFPISNTNMLITK